MGKGARRERQAKAVLNQAGYAVYRPETAMYGENDPWGLFDLLAIAPHRPLRAIQVKSNRAQGVRSWARHTRLWRAHGFVTEYWVCHDREGWRVIQCREAGKRVVVVDERKHECRMGNVVIDWLAGQ